MWWRWRWAAAAGAGEAVVLLGEDEGGLRLLGLVVGGGCARADARRALVWFDWEGIGAPDTVLGVGGGLPPFLPPFLPPLLLSILYL